MAKSPNPRGSPRLLCFKFFYAGGKTSCLPGGLLRRETTNKEARKIRVPEPSSTGPLPTMLTTPWRAVEGSFELITESQFLASRLAGPGCLRGAWNWPSPGCMCEVFPLLYFVAWLTCSCRGVMRLSTALGTAQFVTSCARASKSCASVLLKYLVFRWRHRKRHVTLGRCSDVEKR